MIGSYKTIGGYFTLPIKGALSIPKTGPWSLYSSLIKFYLMLIMRRTKVVTLWLPHINEKTLKIFDIFKNEHTHFILLFQITKFIMEK